MNKIKMFITLILAVSILGSSAALAESFGVGNFEYVPRYTQGQFRDVDHSHWFSEYVRSAYNFGLLRGTGADSFEPNRLLTLGEAVVLAARMRSVFFTGHADFPTARPFFLPYVDYALEYNIIDSGEMDFFAPATRAQLADMIFRSLPSHVFAQINHVSCFAIADVSPHDDFAQSIYALYRAGILRGSDRFGTFFPSSTITRAESSALLVRTVNPDSRVNITLPTEIPAEVIFSRVTDAVFMIETFDENGRSIRTASGFFLTSTGMALTNFHVFDFAESATVTLTNGNVYNIDGFYSVCMRSNLAVFSIDAEYDNFSTLTLGDSDLVETGNLIYALGSPMQLMNSLSSGVVSSRNREVNGRYYIQFSAPISFGSGGSALLNSLGQVIGITYLSFTGGQNLNLAVPINRFRDMVMLDSPVSFELARNVFDTNADTDDDIDADEEADEEYDDDFDDLYEQPDGDEYED